MKPKYITWDVKLRTTDHYTLWRLECSDAIMLYKAGYRFKKPLEGDIEKGYSTRNNMIKFKFA